MATFVLVHGAAHGGWCYKKLKRILEQAGHEVFAPTLSGLADRSHLLSPRIDLEFHINDVVQTLYYWDLRDVVLVGHSYGGMVITGAADLAGDRIEKLVYLDSVDAKNGQSLNDLVGPVSETVRSAGAMVNGVELVFLPDSTPGTFFGVTDPTDLVWMGERLTGHPWLCFEQKLTLNNEEALNAIPQYHIVCESMLATHDPDLMETARVEGRLWQIDAGHDLMITEPQFVADTLIEIAG